jgi:hypothetical protein
MQKLCKNYAKNRQLCKNYAKNHQLCKNYANFIKNLNRKWVIC